jgi:phenylalanyl-tRNA synthetase beta chain
MEKHKPIKFKELPKYPSVAKDLSFVMSKTVESSVILDILKKVGSRMLSNVEVFDVYTGKNVEPDQKSIAYALTFQDESRTLTDEEVTKVFNQMIETVEAKTEAKLRN